jgi:protein phosphatase PTC1
VDSFCGDTSQGFFGLYDGHGGRASVDFITKSLHMNMESTLKASPSTPIANAFTSSYLATDGQLRRQNILRSGSTSVTCIVREEDGKKMLHVANVGDSRAVLARGGKALRLTIDHKATLPEEAKRITEAGGFIGRNKRVNGVLAISRALGDHMLKENNVVTAEPYVDQLELETGDTHVLLACDGVWDVMTDQEAIGFILKKEEALTAKMTEKPTGGALNDLLQHCARALVKEALDRRSLDNVTVMIIAI